MHKRVLYELWKMFGFPYIRLNKFKQLPLSSYSNKYFLKFIVRSKTDFNKRNAFYYNNYNFASKNPMKSFIMHFQLMKECSVSPKHLCCRFYFKHEKITHLHRNRKKVDQTKK